MYVFTFQFPVQKKIKTMPIFLNTPIFLGLKCISSENYQKNMRQGWSIFTFSKQEEYLSTSLSITTLHKIWET